MDEAIKNIIQLAFGLGHQPKTVKVKTHLNHVNNFITITA